MSVQIEFSVDELARLTEHTAMKDIFAQRKKAQAKAAKRKADGPQVLLSPRSQLRENQERARAAGAAERSRQEQARAEQLAQQKEAQARKAAQREELRKLVQEAPGGAQEAPGGAQEAPGGAQGPARARPSKRAAPGGDAATRAELPLPAPAFVDVPTWESVSALAAGAAQMSIEELKPMVRSAIDTAVLCAPRPDGQIRTWNELLAPPGDNVFAADWAAWLSPATWINMPRSRYLGNTQHLEPVTQAGNYNEVLKVTAATPVNDSTSWPPQLRRLGVEVTDDTPLVATLPLADYVVRMTRMDPFPSMSSEPPSYRAMKLEALVDEMTLALQAAARGIGPPIYGAVAWPWERQPGDKGAQKYGMIIIMRKADGNMSHWSHELRKMPQHQPHPLHGPSPVLRRTVEEAGSYLVGLCFHIGWTQHINYDMKQGNLLIHETSGQFYMTDFDVMYYRYVPPAVAGVKACFFVNLLLLAMHVRAYSDSNTVTNSLVGVFTPILVELWSEALRLPAAFGNGAGWLKLAKIAPTHDVGSFDHRQLARLDPSARLGAQLSMMVFEYLFDDTGGKRPPPAAAQWDQWVKKKDFVGGYKPLVPQLLKFALLYTRAYPERLRAVFEADALAGQLDAAGSSSAVAVA